MCTFPTGPVWKPVWDPVGDTVGQVSTGCKPSAPSMNSTRIHLNAIIFT